MALGFHTLGKWSPIDKQDVVRMNRDTLYSSGVFDLKASPLTIILPDAGKHFHVYAGHISEDHYTVEVVVTPQGLTFTHEDIVGTRYVYSDHPHSCRSPKPRRYKGRQYLTGCDQGRAGLAWASSKCRIGTPFHKKKIRDALSELWNHVGCYMPGAMFGRQERSQSELAI